MCGIIGVVSSDNLNVSPLLIDGLKRLEYRGYDSAGIATISGKGDLLCRRAQGKLSQLESELRDRPIYGSTGIGHTRWATHGQPTTANAHPHCTDKVAVVHNGIIENFHELRQRLSAAGRTLTSETDTEVIPHLITSYLEQGLSPEEAVTMTSRQLSGSYALAILFAGQNKFMMATRRGSPLALGYGDNGYMYVGSDAIALAPFTSHLSYLEDGDIAHISAAKVSIWDQNTRFVDRPVRRSAYSESRFGKGNHKHFMLKEIYEQPTVLADTLAQYVDPITKTVQLPELPFKIADVPHMAIVACGTSYYAGMIAKYWLEKYAKLPVTLDIASEFRYRQTHLPQGGVALFVSQSGETADTLAALHLAKQQGQHIVSIVNVIESSMALSSHAIMPTVAGPEIGVASTKAFTTQILVAACVALAFARERNGMGEAAYTEALAALAFLPSLVTSVIEQEETFRTIAHEIMHARDVLFMGRGTSYPVALEGALKLKELTYIHAEGIAAGELKHGPLALVSDQVPIFAIAPSDELFEKTVSNMQEVSARGGKLFALTDAKGAEKLSKICSRVIVMPEAHPLLAPILYTIPLQFIAYHAALAKGHDVDQPRNLAKSVTVE